MTVIRVVSKPCPDCQKVKTFEVNDHDWLAWKEGRMHIQTALPEMSASDRERFMTGYCPSCWDKMFAGDCE